MYVYIYIYNFYNYSITLMVGKKTQMIIFANEKKYVTNRVFVNGPGEQGSIPGSVIPKTQKMVFDSSLVYKAL